MKVIEMKIPEDRKAQIQSLIKEFKEKSEEYTGVLLIGVDQEGSPAFYTEGMNHMERCYAAAALNAFCQTWFFEAPSEGDPAG